MIISFSNLEHEIILDCEAPVVFQIENQTLFGRICQALISGKEEEAIEPYSLWDSEGNRLKHDKGMIIISDPFDLPWRSNGFQNGLQQLMERMADEDEQFLAGLRSINYEQQSLIKSITTQMNGEYSFALEWNLVNILKAFRFGVDLSENMSLLDNLIAFIDMATDLNIDEALVFINLKTFLSKSDLFQFYERLFFYQMRALLIENHENPIYNEMETNYIVDRDFVEYKISRQSEYPSSMQGRICSDGFGAVEF